MGYLTKSAIIMVLMTIINYTNSELTPPYFNLAEGRKIYSSATCGVGTDGPELYCKLVGAVGNESERLIQGQVRIFFKKNLNEIIFYLKKRW